MRDTGGDRIVEEYLHQLEEALGPLPGPRRRQLVDEIGAHVHEARRELANQSEGAVRDLLDRVGRPEEIAAEALDGEEPSAGRPAARGARTALAVAVVGVVLAVLAAGGGALAIALSGPSAAGRVSSPRAPARSTPPTTSPPASSTPPTASRPASSTPPTTFPPASSTPASSSGAPGGGGGSSPGEPPAGIYVDGGPGTAHYFVAVHDTAGGLWGSVDFLYQDGQTSVVLTFTGSVVGQSATLEVTSVPQGGGSASEDPAAVPSAIAATFGGGALELGECVGYLHFVRSMAGCTFGLSPTGAP